jgi:hypothetical protein
MKGRRLISACFAWGFVTLVGVLCLWVSFWRYYDSHKGIPKGCDEFGYLYQADAISRGCVFDNHTDRPFLPALTKYLDDEGVDSKEYMWMVAPHAYLYDAKAGKIINQYPPGTSIILSVFPWEYRKLVYPVVSCALMLMLVLLARRDRGWLFAARVSMFFLIAILGLAVQPFSQEFKFLGSTAPSFAILIAAGWYLRSRPGVSLALVSLCVLFRISCVIFLPLVMLAYVFPEYFSEGHLPSVNSFIRRSLKGCCVVFFSGILWILIFQWLVTGSPFRTTYPPHDQAFSNLKEAWGNACFYFKPSNGWFIFHLVVLAAMTALFHGTKERRRVLYLAFLIVACNYAFFILHRVHIVYYPYGSAMLLAGMIISGLEFASPGYLRVTAVNCACAVVIILVYAWPSATVSDPAKAVLQARDSYRRALARADVVWGAERSGSVEYATGKPGFRFIWSTAEVRAKAMLWLRGHGYTQALLIDDDDRVNPDDILKEINNAGLKFTITDDPLLHRIAWLEASKK